MKEKLIREEQESVNQTIVQIEEVIQELKNRKGRPTSAAEAHVEASRLAKIQNFDKALQEPYIGKLEIAEVDSFATYIIGKIGVADVNFKDLVYDWRTPIGDAYYSFNGGDGTVRVKAPEGPLSMKVNMKRTVQIRNRSVMDVRDYFSSDYKGPSGPENVPDLQDPLLRELWRMRRSDHQIREIIATIQKEQNEIIRLGIGRPILVQGVAGSGKTSIALHRISYLLYQYGNQLAVDNIMVLAPNRIFLDYMREIVKDLDIREVRQSTGQELALSVLKNLKEIRPAEYWLDKALEQPEDMHFWEKMLFYKTSLRFYEASVLYLKEVERVFLPHDVPALNSFSEQPLNIIQIFTDIYNGYQHLPLNKRRTETVKSIQSWMELELTNQKKALEKRYLQFKREWTEELHDTFAVKKETEDKMLDIAGLKLDLQKSAWTQAVKAYIDGWKPLDPWNVYQGFCQQDLLLQYCLDLDPDVAEGMAQEAANFAKLGGKSAAYEDLGLLIILERRINGIALEFDYLVIDEAQDYYPFLIQMLKEMTKSMTLLGDVTQSICSWTGFSDWQPLQSVFGDSLYKLDLTISYRSTVEVMQLANQILHRSGLGLPEIHPVNRNGEAPIFIKVTDFPDLMEKMTDAVRGFREQSYGRIAVIVKNSRLCRAFYEEMPKSSDYTVQLVENPEQKLEANVVFITAALAKGLEFDAVVIPDTYGDSTLDARLLFVSVTRAQEAVKILYFQNPSFLLRNESP